MGKTGIYKTRCWECWEKHERGRKQVANANKRKRLQEKRTWDENHECAKGLSEAYSK